jgi:signal transduction histidine kinase
MQGRIKGESERILTLAHQIEMFARQKTIGALSHYLATEKENAEAGASKVLALFKRLAERKKPDGE